MPRRKKNTLPSGSTRKQIYDHSELVFDESGKPVIDPKTGKQKKKRIYHSVTGKYSEDVKLAAAKLKMNKDCLENPGEMTLSEAIDKYVNDGAATLSPSTIRGYKIIQRNGFQSIMPMKIRSISNVKLREALSLEAQRPVKRSGDRLSSKTVVNEYRLLSAVLRVYAPNLNTTVPLPQVVKHQNELTDPDEIFRIVKGSSVELPVLLAMWLSFTESEIEGLYKSKSISPDGNYITVNHTKVRGADGYVEKETTKQPTRRRKHRIPSYIKDLIDQVPGDKICTLANNTLYESFTSLMKKAGKPHMTFHDLRHVNASVMAILQVPDKYAQERGGWKTDNIMKDVYTQTFSKARVAVDNNIDAWFEQNLGLVQESIPESDVIKIRECEEAIRALYEAGYGRHVVQFVEQMQHEMQHDKNKIVVYKAK